MTVAVTYTVGRLQAAIDGELPPALWLDPVYGPPNELGASAEWNCGAVDPEGQSSLAILAAPEVRIEARAADPFGTRLVLARRGEVTVRAVRSAQTVTVDRPHCDGSGARLAVLVSQALPVVWCANHCPPVSFPTDDGVELLTWCRTRAGDDASRPDSSQLAAGLRGLGVASVAAAKLSGVLAHAETATEVTLAASGRILRSVVAVIDSPRGRVVATTAPASDGRLWTTVSEGSVHRIGQALRRACEELPGGAWLP